MRSFVCLAERPIGRRYVVGDHSLAVASRHHKGEALAAHVDGTLPYLPKVPGHCHPTSFGTSNGHGLHVPHASDVGDKHQVHEVVTAHGEVNATSPYTRSPEIFKNITQVNNHDLSENSRGFQN